MREFSTGLGRKSCPVFGDMRTGRKRTYFSGKSPFRRKRAIDKYRGMGEDPYGNTHGNFQAGVIQVGDMEQLFI